MVSISQSRKNRIVVGLPTKCHNVLFGCFRKCPSIKKCPLIFREITSQHQDKVLVYYIYGVLSIKEWVSFFWVHGEWIVARDYGGWFVPFRLFVMAPSLCRREITKRRNGTNQPPYGTNKSREPRSGSRPICLFRATIHSPWTQKKDTHSLYLQCFQPRTLSKILREKL